MPDRRGPSSKNLLSFNGGELSPLLDSRSDLDKIASGCRILENMVVDTTGEIRRRAGTRKIAVSNNTFVSS